MFQIELLSGGVFLVYAVDAATSNFLIYKNDAWQWTPMDWCKPFRYRMENLTTKNYILPVEEGVEEPK